MMICLKEEGEVAPAFRELNSKAQRPLPSRLPARTCPWKLSFLGFVVLKYVGFIVN